MKGRDTENFNNLFSDEIKNRYILHIPHANINIPNYTDFNIDLIDDEILKLTDWATDIIFNVDNIDKIITPFSRVFCDVERLDDDNEIMYNVGRGIYYTNTDNGNILRTLNENNKINVINEYYNKHHLLLEKLVENKLNLYNEAIIIDCHSFANTPFNTDLNQNNNRPDICIGTDNIHTPQNLIDKIVNHFKSYNLSVEINSPYSGTIVPLKYNNNSNVKSIMIELNRDLYMDDYNTINLTKVIKLQKIINNLF